MADIVTPEKRSAMMSGIKGKDTRPEMTIRRGLHALGFRYRLDNRKIPGRPDLVLPKYNAVIFIHGCFWHQHECHLFKWPSTRQEFWFDKISENKERDKKTVERLLGEGWRVMIVWECTIRGKTRLDQPDLLNNISKWLQSKTAFREISA